MYPGSILACFVPARGPAALGLARDGAEGGWAQRTVRDAFVARPRYGSQRLPPCTCSHAAMRRLPPVRVPSLAPSCRLRAPVGLGARPSHRGAPSLRADAQAPPLPTTPSPAPYAQLTA